MPLSEHVYCVAITFKMTEWVDQQICIKFCVKFEHSSTETTRVIQKSTANGNWWLAASSWQCAHSCITPCATSNHPVTQSPYSPDLATCDFWLFPKLKSPLKGKRFQTVDVRKVGQGSWWRLGNCVRCHGCLLWRGLRHHCSMYNVSYIWYLIQ